MVQASCPAVRLFPVGNLYGTGEQGGTNDYGSVFRLTANGVLTCLVDFNNANGAYPLTGLILGPAGNFYGTTYRGGLYGYGTIFQLTTNNTLNTLVNFAYTNGAYPFGGLALGRMEISMARPSREVPAGTAPCSNSQSTERSRCW